MPKEEKPKEGALRVWWIPQVPMKPFYVEVKNIQEAGSDPPPPLPQGVHKLSINQLAGMVNEDLNMDDEHNVEARIWRPSLPVIHLASAVVTVMDQLEKSTQSEIGIFETVENPSAIDAIIDCSNEYAELLLKSTKVTISPEDLIRFRIIK